MELFLLAVEPEFDFALIWLFFGALTDDFLLFLTALSKPISFFGDDSLGDGCVLLLAAAGVVEYFVLVQVGNGVLEQVDAEDGCLGFPGLVFLLPG